MGRFFFWNFKKWYLSIRHISFFCFTPQTCYHTKRTELLVSSVPPTACQLHPEKHWGFFLVRGWCWGDATQRIDGTCMLQSWFWGGWCEGQGKKKMGGLLNIGEEVRKCRTAVWYGNAKLLTSTFMKTRKGSCSKTGKKMGSLTVPSE